MQGHFVSASFQLMEGRNDTIAPQLYYWTNLAEYDVLKVFLSEVFRDGDFLHENQYYRA